MTYESPQKRPGTPRVVSRKPPVRETGVPDALGSGGRNTTSTHYPLKQSTKPPVKSGSLPGDVPRGYVLKRKKGGA